MKKFAQHYYTMYESGSAAVHTVIIFRRAEKRIQFGVTGSAHGTRTHAEPSQAKALWTCTADLAAAYEQPARAFDKQRRSVFRRLAGTFRARPERGNYTAAHGDIRVCA